MFEARGQFHVWGEAEVSHGAVSGQQFDSRHGHTVMQSENHRSLLSYCELEELFCLWAHGSACLTLCRHN